MTIEKRIYKFNASREDVNRFLCSFENQSPLKAGWISEHTFSVQKRSGSLFKLEGITDELENAHKLKIFIRTDYRYPLLFILPIAALLAGIFLWITRDIEQGQLLAFGGFSLSGFIYLISLTVIDRLKKGFKEGFQII